MSCLCINYLHTDCNKVERTAVSIRTVLSLVRNELAEEREREGEGGTANSILLI